MLCKYGMSRIVHFRQDDQGQYLRRRSMGVKLNDPRDESPRAIGHNMNTVDVHLQIFVEIDERNDSKRETRHKGSNEGACV